MPNGVNIDQPRIGFNRKWIAVQVDAITNPTYSAIFVFDKAPLLEGTPPHLANPPSDQTSPNYKVILGAPNYGRYICPARTYDADLDDLYCLRSSPTTFLPTTWDSLLVFKISGSSAVTAELFEVGSASSNGNSWTSRLDNSHAAPQPGHPNSIISDDDRIHSCVYRNGSLWTAQTVSLPAGQPTVAAVQWWQISLFPSISVVQRARIGGPGGEGVLGMGDIVQVLDEDKFVDGGPEIPSVPPFRTFASLAVNANEDVLIGYSYFSLDLYPSAASSFRLGTDPLGILQPESVEATGESFYERHDDSPPYRWGDYSAAVVDPINDRDMWTIQEYAGSPLIDGPNPDPNTGWKTNWLGVLKTFGRFAAGQQHGFGQRLFGNLRLSASGNNMNGQLGTGDPAPSPTPASHPVGVVLPESKKIIDVAAGTYTSLAVDELGTVYVWGRNQYGLLGNGSPNIPAQTTTPIAVPNLHLFANNYYVPVSTSFGNNPSIIAANWGDCAAVDNSGHVWTWGLNNDGQLGDGTTTNRPSPGLVRNDASVPFTPLSGVVSITVGQGQMIALKADGTVWAWGRGDRGALGDGSLAQHNQFYPQQVKKDSSTFLTNVAQVVCGSSDFSLALTKDGKIYGWGQNGRYQLGLNSNAQDHEYATLIPFPSAASPGTADRISAGAYHSLAHCSSDGLVYAWGDNAWGEGGFGVGSTTVQQVPRPMAETNSGFTDLEAGAFFSLMIRGGTEEVFGTGDNQSGQLATDDRVTKYSPVRTGYHLP